jgi:NDP-sugar pyrophosphorylase family protein
MLDRIPDDESAVMDQFSERVLFPGIIADGLRVQGFEEDLWVDVGSPERYLLATQMLLERMTSDAAADVLVVGDAAIAGSALIEGPVAIADGVRVGERAQITGPCVLGARAFVGDDAIISGSVLWADASVADGTRIATSILADGVSVGDRASMSNAVLASGAVVGEGIALPDGARVMPGERV